MIILFVFLSILSLCLLLWQISNLVSVIFGSPYVKTNRRVIRQALKLAGLKKGEIFYDLGCGNGDVLIEAAKLGAKAVGFEISPFYYALAKTRTTIWRKLYNNLRWSKKNGIGHGVTRNDGEIIVSFKNIYNIDLSGANVIYCYLLPEMLRKLKPKFKKELKKGSRLISIGFPVKGLKLKHKHKVRSHTIYIYQI